MVVHNTAVNPCAAGDQLPDRKRAMVDDLQSGTNKKHQENAPLGSKRNGAWELLDQTMQDATHGAHTTSPP